MCGWVGERGGRCPNVPHGDKVRAKSLSGTPGSMPVIHWHWQLGHQPEPVGLESLSLPASSSWCVQLSNLGGLPNCTPACDSCPGPAAISALSYTALAGTSSPAYNNTVGCSVTVGGVNGGVPALSFTSFSMVARFDVVRLFDGRNSSAPLLGIYSGTWKSEHMVLGNSGTSSLNCWSCPLPTVAVVPRAVPQCS
jgi:hypothetical protein